MKTAKNGKSSFENLATVIDKLEEDQFAEILEKTKDKTKIFLSLLRQRLAKNPIDIVSEHDFPEVKTKNFSKLIENSYTRVLTLLAELWKKDKAKEWQKDVERRIDEIEGLCFIQLYEQAAVQLSNLEDYLFKKEHAEKIHRFFDDWVLISRMANLKVYLSQRSHGILEPDELDDVIHACNWVATDLNQNSRNISEWALQESKAQFHNYIAHNLLNQRKLNQFISEKKNHLRHLQSQNKDHVSILSQLILWEIALANFKNGQFIELERTIREMNNDLIMPSLIVRQQLFELHVRLKIDRNEFQEWSEIKSLWSAHLYNKDQIKNLDIRIEINQIIIQFLQNHFQESLDDIKALKQTYKLRLRSNRPIYRDVLFMELLSSYLIDSFAQTNSIIRNLGKVCDKETFEMKATQVLTQITKYGASTYLKPFAEENPEKFKNLKSLSKNGEPIHALILSFLKGNFRPVKTSIF